ncbi:MAG: DUF3828 domain-containing protein [Methyloceanibacter sp.]|uniref:DUF3828 domain-containing protein n=1 Tax=Methyloceanibacter sp. TaxID=1965321 RepID=UPI003EE0A400
MRLAAGLAVLLALGAVAACGQDDEEAPAKQETPSEAVIFVSRIYEAYTDNKDDDPVQPEGSEIYSKRLQALLDKDAAETQEGEVGRLDFDPFVDGQDWEIGGLKVKEVYRSGGEARVRADFANFGKPRSILFSLVREGGEWRIDDIAETLPPRWTLSKILTGAPDAFPDAKQE